MKIKQLSRFVILALVAVMLMSDASALLPAGGVKPADAAFPGPNVIISFFRAFGALSKRNQLYREAGATSAEVNAYYDTLVAQAKETRHDMIAAAAAGKEVSPVMARAYVRAEAALEAERSAAIAMIEVEKNQARKDFERTIGKEIVNVLIASPGGQRIIGQVRDTIGGAMDAAQAVQEAVESGSPVGALQDLLVEKVGDFPLAQAAARQAGSAVGHVIDRALGGVLTKVENAINHIQDGMGEALDVMGDLDAQVAKVDETEKQPVSLVEDNSLIGEIFPVDRANAVADVAASAYAGAAKIAGALGPGESRGAMRDRIRDSLLDERVKGIRETVARHGVGEVYCISVDRAAYEAATQSLGESPEVPDVPERAIYKVCYVNQTRDAVFARMYGGEAPRVDQPAGEESAPPPAGGEGEIPVGSYTGESRFPTKRANTSDSDSELVIVVNSVTLTVDEDGTTHGELLSQSFTTMGEFLVHSDVTGIISGQLLGPRGQLTVAYTWHSYISGTPCTAETPCNDDTVEFVFPYHATVADGMMVCTPAADVEDYYDFELTRQ